MKIAGIIAEYNPFHRGHAYQIRQTRELSGADYVVVVLSPDFVQRGAPALLDQHLRCRMALSGGADLVLALPVCYACAGAEYFAAEAVRLLDRLDAIDLLSFGCETPCMEDFSILADLLAHEPADYRAQLRAALKNGLPFPAAREQALQASLPEDSPLPKLLRSPNNILALEYLRALRAQGSSMKPFALPRLGSGYHSGLLEEFSSASAIRSALFQGRDVSAYLPEGSAALLKEAAAQGKLNCWQNFSALLGARLFEEEDFSSYLDVGEELSRRILRHRFSYHDPDQFAALLKTRQLTLTRIYRALLHILLRIRAEQVAAWRQEGGIFHARILGFRREAGPLLHRLSETARIPLIAKPAAFEKQLTGAAADQFRLDLAASHLYQLGTLSAPEARLRSELTRSPVIL